MWKMFNEDVCTEAVDPSDEVPLPLPGLYSSVLINAAMGPLPWATCHPLRVSLARDETL